MIEYGKWIWLAEKCGHGNKELLNLIEKFATIDMIYGASFEDYINNGVSERLASDLTDKSLTHAEDVSNLCRKYNVGILCYEDKRYPNNLRQLINPPAVLYYMGELPDFNKDLFIAMVGTRRMSEYGMGAAYKISYEIAAAGACVISGMALGIDGVCASAAIAAGGKTVAVLGCGVDVDYPKAHATLKQFITENGAVISEYPPNTKAFRYNFPMRNRIISGISQATVVIEADLDSGAMITARQSILQGKDIFAVPSNIDSENSTGTNSLIRDGAQAVLRGSDIIRNYGFLFKHELNIGNMRDAEKKSELDRATLRYMGVGSRSDQEALGLVEKKKRRARYGVEAYEEDDSEERRRIINFVNAYAAEQQEKERREADAQQEKERREADAQQKSAPKDSFACADETRPYDKSAGDRSRAVLETLSEAQRTVFDAMPLDRPVTVDYLTKTGLKLKEVISALTILEIKGLVSSCPGAIYIRR